MFPNDYFDNDGLSSGLAWLLFAENGQPGYYMLYKDLLDLEQADEDERLR